MHYDNISIVLENNINDNLIAHYPFNGNANDESGNGNDGTENGGVTLTADRFGNTNSAYSFDGVDDYIDIGKQIYTGTDNFSISIWVKSAGIQPNIYSVPLSQGHDSNRRGFGFQYGWPLSTPMLLIIGNGIDWEVSDFSYEPDIDFDWHNLVATKEGSTFKTYFDGTQIETVSYSLNYGTFNLNIGRDSYNTAENHRSFYGDIDDIRLYTRALSQSEIDSLYNEGGCVNTLSITSHSPTQNALNIANDAIITISFDTTINTSTLDSSTFTVRGDFTGQIPGAYQYNEPAKTITFTPDENFKAGEIIWVTLTTDIRTTLDGSLANTYNFSFTIDVTEGNGQFKSKSDYTAGDLPLFIDAADFDKNGNIDLAVANYNSGTVSIYMGNGDGTFQPKSDITVENTPTSVIAADFNNDGMLDIAVTHRIGEDSVSILLGNGNGTFNAKMNFETGSAAYESYPGDLNGDGNLDLVTVNSGSNNISVLLGNGDGTFLFDASYSGGDFPMSIHGADFDLDGDIDIVTAYKNVSYVSVYLNNGDATFANRSDYLTAGDSYKLFTADLNNDGIMDIAACNTFAANISILLGNGDGTFGTQTAYNVNARAVDIPAADFNNDGYLDLALSYLTYSTEISILPGDGSGAFNTISDFSSGSSFYKICTGDFNNDGSSDIAVTNYNDLSISVLLNNSISDTSLIAYYPFNGNAHDESGNGNNGIEHGSILLTADRFGNNNRAYFFDQVDDWIEIPHNPTIDFANSGDELSVFAWIKTSSEGFILNKNPGTTTWDPGYRLAVTSGKIDLMLEDNTHSPHWYGSIINDDKWHFIGATLNSSTDTAKVYIDGQIDFIADFSGVGSTANTELLGIGSRLGSNLFNGVIDDVRIYNKILSYNEIQQLYHEDNWETDTTYIPGGIITQDVTWTKANSPYRLIGDVSVESGGILTIEPGVEVYLGANEYLVVKDGSLIAEGTESDSIRIYGSMQFDGNGEWCQIMIGNGYNSYRSFKYCHISNIGGSFFYIGQTGNAVVENNSIYSPAYFGTTDTIKHNTFYHQVTAESDKTVVFRQNNILNGMNTQGAAGVDAKFNYWGPNTTVEMNSGNNPKNIDAIIDAFDNSTVEYINYSHWLDAPWPGGQPVGNSYDAEMQITDNQYEGEMFNYHSGDSIFIQIIDTDQNSDNLTQDQITIDIWSELETTHEIVTLTETGSATAIFRGYIPLDDTTGSQVSDGKLQVNHSNFMYFQYIDPADDWGNIDTLLYRKIFNLTKITKQHILGGETYTIEKNNSPYILLGDMQVDGILHIEPGVKIYFPSKYDDGSGSNQSDSARVCININGKISVNGVENDSVYFLAIDPNGNNDDWAGFSFGTCSSVGIFRYAILMGLSGIGYCSDTLILEHSRLSSMYGIWTPCGGPDCNTYVSIYSTDFIDITSGWGWWQSAAIFVNSEYLYVIDSRFINCKRGICIGGREIECIIKGNLFQNASEYALNTILNNSYSGYYSISENTFTGSTRIFKNGFWSSQEIGNFKLRYNNFQSNLTSDQFDPASSNLDARYNYWGSIATAEMNTGINPKNISTINDYYDDPNKGKVNYSRWLDAPWPDGTPAPGGCTGELEFIYSDGTLAWGYNEGDTLFVRLYDPDLNLDINNIDTTQVKVWSQLETTPEILLLTEIESDKGLFMGWMILEQDPGYPIEDGILQVDINNKIWTSYNDALDDWNNSDIIITDSVQYNLQIQEYEPDENTVLLLHFNEGNGQTVYDFSGNGYNGIFGSSSEINSSEDPTWIPGISGDAVCFDGINQYIKISKDAVVGLTEGTIEAWILPYIIDSDNWFISYAMDTDKGVAMCIDNNKSLCAQLDQSPGGVLRSNPGLIKERRWHHVAMTWDNSKVKLYLNGVLDSTFNHPGYPQNESQDLYIGIDSYHREYYSFDGIVDEVRISNIARTSFDYFVENPPGEINDLSVSDSSQTSIILQWHAPGENRYTGTCTLYDMRMSASPIDSVNFHMADSLTGIPVPEIAGSLQSFTVENLNSGTTYYFALKAVDDEGQWSPISNIATGKTLRRYLTDERDGQVYEIQRIGYQTWFAENLNYYTGNGSWYYNDDSLTYADTLGRLFDWATAMNIDPSYNSVLFSASYPHQGVCPDGWHIPTDNDWKVLEKTLGMLPGDIELTGWRGTDQGLQLQVEGISGFQALMAGFLKAGNDYTGIDSTGIFWTASEFNGNGAWIREVDTIETGVNRIQTSKENGISIRCIEDIPRLTLNLAGTYVTKINGSDGLVDLTVSGGISPYTFSWSNGNITEDIDSLSAGTYIITVTDVRDSIAIDSISIKETFLDNRDRQRYIAVKMGKQTWMAENLNFNSDTGSWYYDNDSIAYADTLGGLYSRETAMVACPDGWYLPGDDEWKELEMVLGLSQSEADNTGWRGTSQGTQLQVNGTSGFEAIFSGFRSNDEIFTGLDSATYFWSSTEYNSSNAIYRALDSINSGIYRNNLFVTYGASVRCILDTCSLIEFDFTVTNISCFSESDGAISLSVSGGKESYYYLWSNNDTTATINGLSPGKYTVTVTDSVGCSKTDSIIVTEPYLLETSITDSTNISCYSLSDGSATVTPAGGTEPYSYLWDNPSVSTGSEAAGLSANYYYYVNVTDANGCTATVSVMLSEPPPVEVSFGDDTDFCIGDNLILTPGDGFAGYTWSIPDSTGSRITVNTPGIYSVTVTDNIGCEGFASVFVSYQFPYENEEICLVTVDNESGKNMVVWEKTYEEETKLYKIYRESTTMGEYDLIGEIPFDEFSIFVDSTSNPRQRSYQYKISVVDSCGNESQPGFYHRTLLLSIGLGVSTYNLSWNYYLYEGGGFIFSKYYIFRGPSPNELEVIDSIAGNYNAYIDVAPPAGLLYYQIAGIKPEACNPSGNLTSKSGNYSLVLSNMENNSLTQVDGKIKYSEDLLIYPNPFTNKTIIEFPNSGHDSYKLIVVDISGRIVHIKNNIMSSKVEFDRGNLPEGFYFIELKGPRIYRGKMMIE